MSENIKLQPDESVILRADEIEYGGPFSGGCELILTNKNIILNRKGLLGLGAEVKNFPLSDIHMVNGEPQVALGKKSNVTTTLDVYFESGMESFGFIWEKDVKEWIASITEVMTGRKVEREDEFAWVKDTLAMASTVEEAADKVRNIFGIKSNIEVSCNCPSCGAALTGTKGETKMCPFCGNPHTF